MRREDIDARAVTVGRHSEGNGEVTDADADSLTSPGDAERREPWATPDGVRDLAIGSWEWEAGTATVHCSRDVYRICDVDPDGSDFRALFDSVHPEDRAFVARRFETAVAEARPYRCEHRVVRGDGSVRWVHTRGEPVVRDGEVVRMHGFVLDVTEGTHREERWRTFLEDAVHELRAPVATLVQAADLLAARFDDLDRERREATLGTLRRQGQRLRALAEDLLDLSEVERTSEARREQRLDLAAAVTSALEVATPPGHVDVDTGGVEPVTVSAGAQPVERILVNLLANAYAYGGDAVSVRTFRDRRDGVLEVSDNGPGVPVPARSELFTAFGASRDERGTGLGLSIVRRLAERAGGEVGYREAKRGGACFVVRLPAPPNSSSARTGVDVANM